LEVHGMALAGHLDDSSDQDPVMHWLRKASPDPARPVPSPASSPTTVTNAVELLGRDPVDWAVQVGDGMARHIIEEIPELGGGEGPFRSLRMGTESATIRALVRLTGAASHPAITDEALQGDREFVRRGVALDRVLRGVRLGHAGMARAFMAACNVLLSEAGRTGRRRRPSGWPVLCARSTGWATSYGDVELPALLTADLGAARTFVRRELGPLANPGAPMSDLRATLTYLEEQNSPHSAAQRLHVSRNTVSYRVKRAEELLGQEWRQRRYELQAALLLARDLGEAVFIDTGTD
jgi:hypothetical protein